MADTPHLGNLVIHGAGGHGQVVAEAAEAAGWSVVGFVDDQLEPGATVDRWPVLVERPDEPIIVAIGDNHTRHALINTLIEQGAQLATVIHPLASVSPSAQIGDGVYIGPMAVVNAQAIVGLGVIVNTAAVVEHHNQIHTCAHIGPNATLCGHVAVGERSLIGAGSVAIPDIHMGDDVIVGAGSVICQPIESNQTLVGNPARPIR